jgi:hypothetical protein
LERREQVFVSSTYLDLKEERRAVIQGLLEADCIPAGMELFPASDNEKWDLIKGVIDDCDYYVLIIGGRYGSIDPDSELSYTEMEFDYAASTGKPIMAFLHGESGSIPFNKSEIDPEARVKLNEFRSKAEQRMVRYWKTADDLDGAVAKSLIRIRKTHPAEGWVRARHAMTPEMERDMAELRAKVSDLTQQLQEARSRSRFEVPEGLADGEDTFDLETSLLYWNTDEMKKQQHVRRKTRARVTVPATWNEILFTVGPNLLDESNEASIDSDLEGLSASIIGEKDLVPEDFGKATEISVHGDTLKDIVVHLFALGLIEHGTKKRQISDTSTYWKLTSLGRDRLMRLRAIRRQEDEFAAES